MLRFRVNFVSNAAWSAFAVALGNLLIGIGTSNTQAIIAALGAIGSALLPAVVPSLTDWLNKLVNPEPPPPSPDASRLVYGFAWMAFVIAVGNLLIGLGTSNPQAIIAALGALGSALLPAVAPNLTDWLNRLVNPGPKPPPPHA